MHFRTATLDLLSTRAFWLIYDSSGDLTSAKKTGWSFRKDLLLVLITGLGATQTYMGCLRRRYARLSLFHSKIDIVQFQFAVTRTEDDTKRDERFVQLSVDLFGGFIFLNAQNDGGHEVGCARVGRISTYFPASVYASRSSPAHYGTVFFCVIFYIP
jgi:hypothetical protein